MFSDPVRTEAPGKVILLGEHAVVYGTTAVGFPLARTIRVEVGPGSGHIRLEADDDVTVPLSRRAASPRELVKRALGRWLSRVDVVVRFGFPPMSGLGSSAALAVALMRARFAIEGRPSPGFDEGLALALRTERVAHAKPSGLDPAICLAGRLIQFQRDGRLVTAKPIPITKSFHFVVGAVGAHGGTRTVVRQVADLKRTSPALMEAAMETLGQSATAGIRAMKTGDGERLGVAMNLAHGVLAGLGLVSTGVASAIHTAQQAGALGAKMSGAGGDGGAFVALFTSKRAADSARDELRLGGVPAWVEEVRPPRKRPAKSAVGGNR